MNLTKNQIYIISAIVILVVAYFLFFKKKGNAQAAAKMATPPPPPAPPAEAEAPAESGYGFGYGNAYEYNSVPALSGNFDPYNMIPRRGAENGFADGSGRIELASNIGVPGISPKLNLEAGLGAGDWLLGGGKSAAAFVSGGSNS